MIEWIIIITIIIAILFSAIFIGYKIRLYNITVIVKETTASGTITKIDKARLYVDKNKNIWWLLLKEKNKEMRKVPIPKDSQVAIAEKGRKIATLVRDEHGTPIWQNAKSIDIGEEEDRQPLTSMHRALLIDEVARAEAKKGKSWKENIVPIVGISALVVIVLALLIFYGEIAKPVITAQQERTAQLEIWERISDNLVSNGQKIDQLISGEVGGNNVLQE